MNKTVGMKFGTKSSFLGALVVTILASTILVPAQAANAVTITAASAVTSVKVSDAWSADTPNNARAKFTWVKPASVYGATIVGYKIEQSSNKTTWKSLVANTGSISTSKIIFQRNRGWINKVL